MHSFEIFISLHVLNNNFFSICMVYWSPSSSLLFALITLQSVKGAGSIKKRLQAVSRFINICRSRSIQGINLHGFSYLWAVFK